MTKRDFTVVTTTHDAEERARALAAAAVGARLAACAQVYRVESVYWWEGEVRSGAEWRVDFKTRAGLADRLSGFLAEHHDYDTPEIIGVPVVTGSAAYLDWLEAETRDD
jgi:periplasmic divalent cation tolerance protein